MGRFCRLGSVSCQAKKKMRVCHGPNLAGLSVAGAILASPNALDLAGGALFTESGVGSMHYPQDPDRGADGVRNPQSACATDGGLQEAASVSRSSDG
jgi:hypothetical protein